ncbi:MAG: DUF6036 family nucleotidyltransferase [Nitrospiria bacterium]
MPDNEFRSLYAQLVTLLETAQVPYFIVGGLATGVLGEPRLTHDVDAIAAIEEGTLTRLLRTASENGFSFNPEEVKKDLAERGTFRLGFRQSWADVIAASTELERSGFSRVTRHTLLGIEANFPSPEDFILLKLIPGRPKDLLDVESVIVRQGDKLDRDYLERWARWIADLMEDFRVPNTLKRLLPPL